MKKENKSKPSINLSQAETTMFQQLDQQQKQIRHQMLELTKSIFESRDVDFNTVGDPMEVSEDFTKITYTDKSDNE